MTGSAKPSIHRDLIQFRWMDGFVASAEIAFGDFA